MKPMKLTDVGQKSANQYIANDDWIMQQKFDGARVMAFWHGEKDKILWTNDGTNPIAFAAAKLALPKLSEELDELMNLLGWGEAILDGELIVETGEYFIFDVVSASQGPMPLVADDTPLDWRLEVLDQIPNTEHIHRTPTARTREDKRVLWEAVMSSGVEGAVSKHLASLWVPGVRSTQWVKHKLVKTADVEVIAATRTFKPNGVVHTGSAVLAVQIDENEDPKPYKNKRGKRQALPAPGGAYAPRSKLTVGAASLIGKDLDIEPGSVVEVNFLYWTGDAMVQPRIMRKREDKPAEECRIDQFAPYTRDLAWAGTSR